jgi:hypothetical protein
MKGNGNPAETNSAGFPFLISIVPYFMIPGSKGQKFDASLLAGEFLTLGPAKNMSK